jgi:hypothetical protein
MLTLKISLDILDSVVGLTPVFGEQLRGLIGIAKNILGLVEVGLFRFKF